MIELWAGLFVIGFLVGLHLVTVQRYRRARLAWLREGLAMNQQYLQRMITEATTKLRADELSGYLHHNKKLIGEIESRQERWWV